MKLPSSRGRKFRIPTSSWSSIEEYYSSLVQDLGWGDEMVDLVRHIRSCGYSERLFAFTSMYELIIGLYPELERGVETLHVLYDAKKKGYQVRYFATPTREPEVERFYPREMGLNKFDDFVGYLKW